MTRDDVLAALDEAGLSHRREQAEPFLQTALTLLPTATTDDALPIGSSKAGGQPDLPTTTPWPHRRGDEDEQAPPRALNFLLQINLGEVTAQMPDSPLPPSGLLSVFYDAEEQPWGRAEGDEDAFKVIYTPGDAPLERCEVPAALRALMDEDALPTAFRPCALRLHSHVPVTSLRQRLSLRSQEGIRLERALQKRYDYADTARSHQLLGVGDFLQSDTAFELAMDELGITWDTLPKENSPGMTQIMQAAGQWRLLLQLDTDEGDNAPGWCWGDAGLLYFFIHERDIAAANFDNVRMELQSS